MADVDRALAEGDTAGFLRVHTKTGTDEIVGATIVARHAGEMISEITTAMAAGIGMVIVVAADRAEALAAGLAEAGETVHRIGQEFQPQAPDPEPNHLVVYRDRDEEVGFMHINPVTARLLQLIDQDMNASGQDLLEIIAGTLTRRVHAATGRVRAAAGRPEGDVIRPQELCERLGQGEGKVGRDLQPADIVEVQSP